MANLSIIKSHIPTNVSEQIYNEKDIFSQGNIVFEDFDSKIIIPSLTAKVSSYRLTQFHPINQNFNFEWHFSQITSFRISRPSCFCQGRLALEIEMNYGGSYIIFSDSIDINELITKFEETYYSMDWSIKKEHKIVHALHDSDIKHESFNDSLKNNSFGEIITTKKIMEQDKKDLDMAKYKINHSFNNLDGLLNNVETLKGAMNYIRTSGQNNDAEFQQSNQKSEADHILSELGAIDILSKSQEGKSFYTKTATQLSEMLVKILPKKGQIMSLIDVYLYYNIAMGMNLISPHDLLETVKCFKNINSALELREQDSGTKVIMFRNYDKQKDFDENLKPHLNNQKGTSVEELAKLSGVSTIVAKIKLNENLKDGVLVLDNSIEGLRYFMNDIIQTNI